MQFLTNFILSNIFSFNWEDPLRPDWGQFHGSQKVAFELLGKFEVRWYALMIMMAIVISVIIGYFGYAKRMDCNSDVLSEGLVVGVVAGVVGGRTWYVVADQLKALFDPNTTTSFTSFKEIINISGGGLAISGAVIFVAVGLFFYCKFRKIRLLYVLEVVMPLIMLSQVIGRWGNFFNQEATGDLINVTGLSDALAKIDSGELSRLPDSILQAQRNFLWFLPDFIIDRMYIIDQGVAGYYHPTFFYEGLANFIGVTAYFLIRRFVKKGVYVGDGISFYLIWYGVVRFFIESMRTDAQMVGNLKVVMLYTPIMVIGGIVLLIVRRVKKYEMVTCYDALYGQNVTWLDKREPKNKKNRKNKIKTEAE